MIKKKSDRHIYWLDTGIFPATVMFSCGFTYDEIMVELKKKKATAWIEGISKDKELIDNGKYFSLSRNLENTKNDISLFYIILKPRFTFTDFEMCILAHEILHTCQFLLPAILNRDREVEAEAYLHTYLMENILKILIK